MVFISVRQSVCNRLIYPSYNTDKLHINLYKPVQSEEYNVEATYPISGFSQLKIRSNLLETTLRRLEMLFQRPYISKKIPGEHAPGPPRSSRLRRWCCAHPINSSVAAGLKYKLLVVFQALAAVLFFPYKSIMDTSIDIA